MLKKEILMLLIMAILLFLGSIAFYFSGILTSPELNSHSVLEDCNPLVYGGENGLNILIFGEEKEAFKYTNYFLESSPFDEYGAGFNFYLISPESYKPVCKRFQEIATFCHSKELIKKAASCPNIDHIIVLDNQPGEIRSSSYLNVMSINTAHPMPVLMHEFGHSFANLAEEYLTNQPPARKSQNCQSSCDDFDGETDGCFQQCSRSTYYRSINLGVMRTLSTSEYGLFNKKIITDLILKRMARKEGITGKVSAIDTPCSDQSYYLIEARKDVNGLQIIDKTIQAGCPENSQDIGEGISYSVSSSELSLVSGKIRWEIFTDGYESSEADIDLIGETYDSFLEGETFIITSGYKEDSQLELIDGETGEKLTENLRDSVDYRGNLACHI